MDVSCIFRIAIHIVATQHALRDHFGESEDRIERRAKLVTHVGEKFGLRAIGDLSTLLGVAQGLSVAELSGDVAGDSTKAQKTA